MPRPILPPLRCGVLALLFAWSLWSTRAAAQAGAPGAGGTEEQVLTRAPNLLQQVQPVYPEEAKAQHLAGDVTLQVDIDADGRVSDVRVLKSAGHGFDEAAMEAVRQFVFSPAEVNYRPAPVQIDYTLHFEYTEPPPPTPTGPPKPPPITLKGHIRERASRVPIAGAAVRSPDPNGPAFPTLVTDANGYFEVSAPVGLVSLLVTDLDHQPFATQETIPAGEQVEVTYYMMPKSYGTFETVVHGQREKKEVTRHTLQREELEAVPGSFGDPVRVVLNLPAMARTPYTIGGLVARGALPFDTGTYFDGVQLPLIFHFGAGPSVVNPEFLDRIDFYPGGFGARYGRAIGGILDIDSRGVKGDSVHGSGKIDLIDTGVYISVPVNDEVTFTAAGRRSYIDLILKEVLKGTTSTQISPVYYDYQARVDYQPKVLPNHKFQLFFMGSNDLLSVVASSNGGPPFSINVDQGFQRLSAKWSYRKKDFSANTMAFFGFDQSSNGIGTNQIDAPATVGGVREDIEIRLHPNLTLRTGVDIQLRSQDVSFYASLPVNYRPFPGSRPNAPLQQISSNVGSLDFGEYVELDVSLPWKLQLLPGFRLDEYYSNGQAQWGIGPRLIMRRPFGDTDVKASVGMYSELPNVQFANTIFGNPSLSAQRAVQTSLGVEQRFTDLINLSVTGFWSYRYDLSAPTTTVNTNANGTVTPLRYAATGIGDAYGMEVLLRHEMSKHFFGWIAYTLSWSQQQNERGQPFYYTTYDERHIFTLIAQYRFGNGWQLGTRFRVVTGAPMTPVINSAYMADPQNYFANDGTPNSARLGTFNQLDLRVDKVWLFSTWLIGVYLDVQNVYNRQNPDFPRWDYRYRTSEFVPDIPILPTLGIKGVF